MWHNNTIDFSFIITQLVIHIKSNNSLAYSHLIKQYSTLFLHNITIQKSLLYIYNTMVFGCVGVSCAHTEVIYFTIQLYLFRLGILLKGISWINYHHTLYSSVAFRWEGKWGAMNSAVRKTWEAYFFKWNCWYLSGNER